MQRPLWIPLVLAIGTVLVVECTHRSDTEVACCGTVFEVRLQPRGFTLSTEQLRVLNRYVEALARSDSAGLRRLFTPYVVLGNRAGFHEIEASVWASYRPWEPDVRFASAVVAAVTSADSTWAGLTLHYMTSSPTEGLVQTDAAITLYETGQGDWAVGREIIVKGVPGSGEIFASDEYQYFSSEIAEMALHDSPMSNPAACLPTFVDRRRTVRGTSPLARPIVTEIGVELCARMDSLFDWQSIRRAESGGRGICGRWYDVLDVDGRLFGRVLAQPDASGVERAHMVMALRELPTLVGGRFNVGMELTQGTSDFENAFDSQPEVVQLPMGARRLHFFDEQLAVDVQPYRDRVGALSAVVRFAGCANVVMKTSRPVS